MIAPNEIKPISLLFQSNQLVLALNACRHDLPMEHGRAAATIAFGSEIQLRAVSRPRYCVCEACNGFRAESGGSQTRVIDATSDVSCLIIILAIHFNAIPSTSVCVLDLILGTKQLLGQQKHATAARNRCDIDGVFRRADAACAAHRAGVFTSDLPNLECRPQLLHPSAAGITSRFSPGTSLRRPARVEQRIAFEARLGRITAPFCRRLTGRSILGDVGRHLA